METMKKTYKSDEIIPEAFREKQIEEVRNINSYGIRISGYIDPRLSRRYDTSFKYNVKEVQIDTFDLVLEPCETWTDTFNYLIILSLLRYNMVVGLFKYDLGSIPMQESNFLVRGIIHLQDFCNDKFNKLIRENCNIEERNPDHDEYWDYGTRREAYSYATTYERREEIFAGLKLYPKYYKAMGPEDTLAYIIKVLNLTELGRMNNYDIGLFQLKLSLCAIYTNTGLENTLSDFSYLDKMKNIFPMLNLWYNDMYFNKFKVTPNNLSPEYFNLNGKANDSLSYFLKILG